VLSLSFITSDVFGESPITGITIQLAVQTNSVVSNTNNTWVSFNCKVTIDNQTHAPLTVPDVTGLFWLQLKLKVKDQNGVELSQLHPLPFIDKSITINAGSKGSFEPIYIARFSLPQSTLRIQLDGKLIGYSGSITSNVVTLKLP
jgi:hypothetical protein